jgi:hypothetical protein
MRRFITHPWPRIYIGVAIILALTLLYMIYREIRLAATLPARAASLEDALIAGLVGALFTLALAVATFVVAYVAWSQLDNLSKTSGAELILQFKRHFYIKETRTLFNLIDRDWIRFMQQGDD